jgi:hypothetical protein
VLSETQIRFHRRHLDAVLAIVLALLALGIRIHSVSFNSLSEDETAKWLAIQQYRQGHFVGVNSEHPMMLKMVAWGSISIGERWNSVASSHGWPSMRMEGWLRLPNVLFGAATAAVLYLLCRLMMGIAGSFAAGFFWTVSPLAVAINRLAKEETALTFFTVLACYAYWRAKEAESDNGTHLWVALSACGFGFAAASQYVLHLFGLNQLAWHVAGRRGLDHKPLGWVNFRFFLLIGLAFLLANPVVLSPDNLKNVLGWLHHDGIRHTGYAFDGKLYQNFPSLVLTGVPWYFYLWMLLVKTPTPILVAILAGSILLLRERQTAGSCIFLTLGVMQLVGLSLSGAKWLRYSLPLLPFLFLAGGYAVQKAWNWAMKTKMPMAVAAVATVVILGWPLLDLQAWAPYYPLYLNPIGGGKANVARYFAPDEISEFDTREVAQQVCPDAPAGARVATARPGSMAYYLHNCGRPDIQIVPLYDPLYVPNKGDIIVLEPSRRFVETQKYFDELSQSEMARREVRVGPVSASTIYTFRQSASLSENTHRAALTQGPNPQAALTAHNSNSTTARSISVWQPSWRR